jgi:cyclase
MYFRLEAVTNGVWVAISEDPVFAMSNAAIVDLGNKTLVFDSSMSVLAALELRRLAQEITGKSVSFLVNSHHHLDHCLGNQVFADCSIISSSTTRDLMQARFARLESEVFAEAILELQHQSASTPWEQNLFALELSELEMLQTFLPQFKPTLPSVTFSSSLEIMGSKRTAKILTFGVGHTVLDAVLIVDDVLITGDLVLNRNLGFMAHGNPQGWLERLDNLEQLKNVQHIVPGHGEAGSTALITDTRVQLLEMLKLGQGKPDFRNAIPPLPWLEYGLPGSYRANLEFLRTLPSLPLTQ